MVCITNPDYWGHRIQNRFMNPLSVAETWSLYFSTNSAPQNESGVSHTFFILRNEDICVWICHKPCVKFVTSRGHILWKFRELKLILLQGESSPQEQTNATPNSIFWFLDLHHSRSRGISNFKKPYLEERERIEITSFTRWKFSLKANRWLPWLNFLVFGLTSLWFWGAQIA